MTNLNTEVNPSQNIGISPSLNFPPSSRWVKSKNFCGLLLFELDEDETEACAGCHQTKKLTKTYEIEVSYNFQNYMQQKRTRTSTCEYKKR